MCLLALVETLHDMVFHASIERCIMIADAIESVESMCNQILGTFLLPEKQAVKPHNLNQLNYLSNFRADLVPTSHHGLQDTCLHY